MIGKNRKTLKMVHVFIKILYLGLSNYNFVKSEMALAKEHFEQQ